MKPGVAGDARLRRVSGGRAVKVHSTSFTAFSAVNRLTPSELGSV
ncbi:hypothetical protein [Nonomuraea longicatena]